MPARIYRGDIVAAARRRHDTDMVGLEETDGKFRVRSFTGNWEKYWDAERKMFATREIDLHVYGEFDSLMACAAAYGVNKR